MRYTAVLRRIALIIVVAMVYYGTSRLSFLYQPNVGDSYALWIPAGLGVAAVLIFGWVSAFGIFAAVFLLRLQDFGLPALPAVALISFVRTSEVCLCAWLMQRISSPVFPRTIRDIFLTIGSGAAAAFFGASVCMIIRCIAGIDHWNMYGTLMMIRWLSDMAGIMILVPLILIIWRRFKRQSVREFFLWTFTSSIAGISIFAFLLSGSFLRQRNNELFIKELNAMTHVIKEEIQIGFWSTNALKSLYVSSRVVESGEFRTFVQQLLTEYPSTLALSWTPRVTRSERPMFEQNLRFSGRTSHHIFEKNAEGKDSTAAERDEYFPMALIEPRTSAADEVGYDLASNSEIREAIIRARDLGEAAATAPFKIQRTAGTEIGVLLITPIYLNGAPLFSMKDRRSALKGVVTGLYTVDSWINRALLNIDPHDIELYFYDITNPKVPLFLAFHPSISGVQSLGNSPPPSLEALQKKKHESAAWDVGGRSWLMVALPGSDFSGNESTGIPLVILFLGLTIAGIILLYFSVRQRIELARVLSENEFRSLADNSASGIVRMEINGNLLYANDAAANVFGYDSPAAFKAAGILKHLIYPDRYGPWLSKLVDAGRISNYELEIVTVSDHVRHLLLSAALIDGTISISFADITDQKRETNELLRLSGVVAQMVDTVIITDRRGMIEYVNPAFERITGFSFAESLGENPSFLKSDKMSPEFYKSLWDTITSGKSFHGEFINRKKNGDLYYETKTVTPIFDETGSIINFLATGNDTTDRKILENTLHRRERDYKMIADNTADVIWILNASLNCFEYMSPAVEKMIGYTVEETLKLSFSDLLEPKSLRRFNTALTERVNAFKSSGISKTYVDEFKAVTKYGSLISLEITTTYAANEAGIIQVIGISRDVTERNRAAAELARSVRNLEATLDAIPHLLFEINDQHCFVDFRAPSLDVLYLSPEIFLGKRYEEIMPPNVVAILSSAFETAERDGHSFGQIYSLSLPDGEHWFELSISLKREPGKERPHFIVLAQDITERKQAEILQETVYQIARAARTAVSLDDLYAEIHRQISNYVSAKNFFIALYDETAEQLRFVYVVDEKGDYSSGDLIPHGSGLSEHVMLTGETLLFKPDSDEIGYHKIIGTPPKVWLGVPLRIQGKNIGVMTLQDYTDEKVYTEREKRMLEFVSSQVAAAIDLKRTEEDVRLIEIRNSAIIKNAPDGIILFNSDGVITFGSPSAFRIFDLVPEEAVGQPALQWIHPDDAEMLRTKFLELVNDPELGFTLEYRCMHSDGSYRWIEGTYRNLLSHPGVHAIVNNFHDITERKETAAAIEKIRTGLEMAQTIAHLGSWDFNILSGTGSWSREMFELFHRDPDLGVPVRSEFMELIHPEDRAILLEEQDLAGRTGSSLTVEYRSNPALGEVQYFDATFVPEVDSGGQLIGMSGTVLDITAAKSAQLELEALNKTLEKRVEERTAELSRSEATYRALFDESQEGILLVTPKGEVIRVNQRLISLLGYTLDDYRVLGAYSFRAFAHDKKDKDSSPRFTAAAEGKDVPLYEDTIFAKDGRQIEAEISLSVVHNDDGSVSLIQFMIRDIGERKKAEIALRESRDRMAAANTALEQASRMKDDFLANMSHEIRTPMNAIIGFSSLALKSVMTPKQRDFISKVHSAGMSLLGIINDILDFSKIEAGKLYIENVDFDLEEVLSNLSTMVSQMIMEKNLEFLLHFPSGIQRSWTGDPLRLGQVLLNLVSNSVKFTSRGDIELSVSIAENQGEKSKLLFLVRDTGIGIPPDEIPRLFQAFTQADSSTTRKYGGTGLGLSISKKLVEMMGGEIWAVSEPEKGSTFGFTVWLESSSVSVSQSQNIPAELTGLRVLVVDDHPAARDIIKNVMSDLNFRVETASSGDEAMVLLSREDAADPFGLVLMDYRMPGIDGIETAGLIKKELKLKTVPAIFIVTGSESEDMRPIAEEAGAEDYLVKPLTARIVTNAIIKHFVSEPSAGEVKPAAEDDQQQELGGLKVLLAEDNEINRQIAEELLFSWGADVVNAVNGREAVDIITRSKDNFDVVLMDIQMPVMDGYEATSLIRADGRFADLPIIAMTAYAMEADKKRVSEAGMNDYISKPFDAEVLFEKLKLNCKRKRDRRTQVCGKKNPHITEQHLPLLVEFDVQDGLARMNGNRQLYAELLGKFAETHCDDPLRILEALKAGDTATAERLAHSLRGVCGNIGAKAAQRAAAAVDDAILKGDRPALIGEALEDLRIFVGRAVTELADVFGSSLKKDEVFKPAAPADQERVRHILSELNKLVGNFDTEAAEYFRVSKEDLLGVFGAESLGKLGKALTSYDFTEASRWLNTEGLFNKEKSDE